MAEIKKAGRAEIPAIIAIIEKAWEPTYSNILSREQLQFMQQEIYNPKALDAQMAAGQEFLLILVADNPAGFASYSSVTPGTFKLNKLYVDPAFQGQDLGRRLIAQVEKEVRRQGATFLILNVNRYNKARSFYERLGYTVIGEEDIPIGQFWMNDFVMQKAL